MDRRHIDVEELHAGAAVLNTTVDRDLERDGGSRGTVYRLDDRRVALQLAAPAQDCWHRLGLLTCGGAQLALFAKDAIRRMEKQLERKHCAQRALACVS